MHNLFNIEVSAVASTFRQGDCNGDGSVSMMDTVVMGRYLSGLNYVDGMAMARMDCDNDNVVTYADYNMLQAFMVESIELPIVTREELTAPGNSSVTYLKYYPASGNAPTQYTLDPLPLATLYNTRNASTDNYVDDENLNVVRFYDTNDPYMPDHPNFAADGTGFIVDDHIIATAAHVFCSTNPNTFKRDLAIAIYNAEGTSVVDTVEIASIHFPLEYINDLNDVDRDNDFDHDYALVHVEEDLSQCCRNSLCFNMRY